LLAACSGQDGGTSDSPDEAVVLVEVDGAPVTLPMLERVMSVQGVGEEDHERMRQLLDELIRMQAVANAARSEGLADDPEVQAELRLGELQTLYRHYINRAQRAEPVTDEAIEAVYREQLDRSGDTQYRIEFIAYGDQAAAMRAIERVEDEQADFQVLKEQARADGRQVDAPGWIDRSQVPESFAAALPDVGAGDVVPVPLETARGWHVVQVAETRPLAAPAIDEVREGIARSLLQQRREALIQGLYDQAEITPMLPLDRADPEAGTQE
jgi:peptidyl-prolyl cis-trans isomerase C